MVMCRVLEVSESGYYAWLKRSTCRCQRKDAQLQQKIRQVFVTHQGRYGSPRILRELRDEGITCSRKRIARLMRKAQLSARGKRCRVLTTKRDMAHPVASNILTGDSTKAGQAHFRSCIRQKEELHSTLIDVGRGPFEIGS